MKTVGAQRTSQRRQLGLSLVELMIAMVIGLVLMGGIIEIFLGSKASYRLTEGLSEVQENGRFAMQFIRKDVRMAGYSGCANNVYSVLNKNAGSQYVYDFSRGIQGFNAQSTGWAPALDNSLSGLTNPPIKTTDVLTVRTVLPGSTNTTQNMQTSHDQTLHISPPQQNPFDEGDIVMLSDCSGATIFQITKQPHDDEIEHTQDNGDPGDSTDDLGIAYKTGAQVQRIATISYFIAARDGSEDCRHSTCGLWQKVGADDEQELVDGIDDMQVLYGVDTDGDEVPNQYRRADQITDWGQVVSVRIALLAVSDENAVTPLKSGQTPYKETLLDTTFTPAKNDLRLRHVFTDTIAIRNRAADATAVP